MKRLIVVNGTMGVGKTATCNELLGRLQPAVFLDGDWCWYMKPFLVNDETKQMVLANISYTLNSFLHCTVYDNIIFCWVMHQEDIIEEILGRLDLANVETFKFTLVASQTALINRMTKDIDRNIRDTDGIERSLARLPMYRAMSTVKIDVSEITAAQAADEIVERILDSDNKSMVL